MFLGYDFQQHRLTPDDLSAGLRGNYHGARTGFELWYQPTATTMIAADASLSTVGPSYNVRLAAGLRAFDAFYVGPEVQAFGADDNYHQFRAGLHVTGFRTGEFEWSVGAGWATDTDDRNSAYGKLGVLHAAANRACGGSASPRSSSRPASVRPAPAYRNADRTRSSPSA